jgi:predicted nucleotidyltransferase
LDPFDPLAALRALTDAGVHFVLIGGVAARVHGSPSMTRDLDICHARDQANLDRLSRALREMHARLRGTDDDVPFQLDGRTLAAGANFTFRTDEGDIDVLALPSGVAGYEELVRKAKDVDVGGVTVKLCDLDDLITMKRAAGRPKDRIELEVLYALRDEIADQAEGSSPTDPTPR